jgi:diaminopimelate epimerase
MGKDMTSTDYQPATLGHVAGPEALPLLRMGKYHGLGNDFLVVIDPPFQPDAALSRLVCDRHLGIGADGLIVGRTREGPAVFRAADEVLRFQLFNADGSEAEMSGNGMRCLAHAALDAGLVDVGVAFGVGTPAGRREVVIERAGAGIWASVEMGRVTVGGAAERCNVGHGQVVVDVGNPHLVVAGPDPATVDVAGLGPRLEATEPAGLNVEFVTLGPGTDEVTMRVWERGVGETLACGTGACAAAVAFHHWGRVGPKVTVHQPGGSVAVEIEPDGQVRLTGPSELIASCEISTALLDVWTAGGGPSAERAARGRSGEARR